MIEQVRVAINAYHFNLDMRCQAAGAALQSITEIEKILDMPYIQGDELRKRSTGKVEVKEQPKEPAK